MPNDRLLERLLGRAVVKLWAKLPKQVQEELFERAIRDDPTLRTALAVHLHRHHQEPDGRG